VVPGIYTFGLMENRGAFVEYAEVWNAKLQNKNAFCKVPKRDVIILAPMTG